MKPTETQATSQGFFLQLNRLEKLKHFALKKDFSVTYKTDQYQPDQDFLEDD